MNLKKLSIGGIAIMNIMCIAAQAVETIDPAKIVYVLRTTKAIKPEMPLNAIVVGKEAIILTSRGPKSTDKDCKIDAVFLSKELFKSFPEQLSRIKILFSKPGTDLASQVQVTAGDVKAFGAGAISAESLLSSLDITDVNAGSTGSGEKTAITIVPGAEVDRRLLLLSRIEALRSKGTSVKPFQDIFEKIEGEVTSAPPEILSKDISYLSEKLSEQEALVKQVSATHINSTPKTKTETATTGVSPDSSSQRVEQRCQEWNTKLERWRKEGRDVAQLIASIAVARMLLADHTPESTQKAGAALDGLDFLFKNGPPP